MYSDSDIEEMINAASTNTMPKPPGLAINLKDYMSVIRWLPTYNFRVNFRVIPSVGITRKLTSGAFFLSEFPFPLTT